MAVKEFLAIALDIGSARKKKSKAWLLRSCLP